MKRPHTLRTRLRRLRRLLRLAMLGVGAGKLLCLASVLILADFALDRAFHLPQAGRFAVLCVAGLALGVQSVRWVLVPLLRPMPAADLALEMEARLAGSADLFASALQFAAQGRAGTGAASLRAAAVRLADDRAGELAPAEFIRWRRVKVWLVTGALAAAVLLASASVGPRGAGIWFRRNVLLASVDWPRRTQLTLLSAPTHVPRGGSAEVLVHAAGVVPRWARLVLHGPDGGDRRIPMQREAADAFRVELDDLLRSVEFGVRAGDGVLEGGRIEVVDRPAVTGASLAVVPPDYTGLPSVELAWTTGPFDVPVGSRVELSVRAGKPLAEAVCRLADGASPAPRWVAEDRAVFDLDVAGDLRGEVVLTDTLGIESDGGLQFWVRAVQDLPPRVELRGNGIGEMVTPSARLPLSIEAREDYGIRRLRLEQDYRGPGDGDPFAPLDLYEGPARLRVEAAPVLELAPLGLPPAGRLILVAVAVDNRVPAEPQTGRSTALSLRLVTPGRLRGALLLRQKDLRRDLEQQIRRQTNLARQMESPSSAGETGRLAAGQQAVARVLDLTRAGYEAILSQMANNRLLSEQMLRARRTGIVDALAGLTASGGPVAEAVAALSAAEDGGSREALPLMSDAVAEMERIRGRMLLAESQASLQHAVDEISVEQRDLQDRTRAARTGSFESLLEE